MPTLIKPKQAEGDFSEIAETKSVVSGALICASGRFSISDPKKLKKYIDALNRLHSRMKSDRKGGKK